MTGDILWTYENLANTKAVPEDAPRMGAWSLLQWARKYQNHFFERLLPKALQYREREEATGKGSAQAQKLEEAEIERLETRLKGFMEGRRRIFCEKCWRELEQSGELGPVRVVHHCAQTMCLRCQGVLEDGESDICRSCAEELARAYGIVNGE